MTSAAEWLALGAIVYMLPEKLGRNSAKHRFLTGDDMRKSPLLNAMCYDGLPLTHAFEAVVWDDGTGIVMARRASLPAPTAAFLAEQHAEARLRFRERANAARKGVAQG